MQNRFFRGAALLVRRYFDHRVARDSAALTYYLLFAIFPLLIFLSNLVGIFAVDIEGFLHELTTIIPAEVLELLIQYLRYVSRVSSRALMTFSLIFSIWFPMRAANALLLSVRKAYGMGRPTHFIRHQAKVFLYTICLFLTILLSLVLVTVGRRVLDFCAGYFHFSTILTDGFIELWSSLRFVLLGVIVFLALAVLYGLAQETRSVHYIWPGVLMSLTAWLALSLLFSLYVENAGNYSVIYGSIGVIIVLLLWLYLSATMMIMGAELNGVLMEVREKQD
ncbi:YihY/virulence factor BrkB family protein [Oscillibacter valericigenes]|nr:YihY/virulence factor BrkB family protein [Oscillibacter valericigenes]